MNNLNIEGLGLEEIKKKFTELSSEHQSLQYRFEQQSKVLNETNKKLEDLQKTSSEEEVQQQALKKKMDKLASEKNALAITVEQEEEFLTNTLQKKLDEVRKEKILIENQLEQEEEQIVNKLQKTLFATIREKNNLEKQLDNTGGEHEMVVSMEEELRKLRKTMKEFQTEKLNYEDQNGSLKDQITAIKTENFLLLNQIEREREKLSVISGDRLQLQRDIELGLERQFNQARVALTDEDIEYTIPGRQQRSLSTPPNLQQSLLVPNLSPNSSPNSNSRRIKRAQSLITNTQNYQDQKVLRQGWMKIKIEDPKKKQLLTFENTNNNTNNNLVYRYLVLFKNGELHHFSKQNQIKPNGNILLLLDTVKSINIEKLNISILTTSKKNYFFEKDNSSELLQWFEDLKSLCPDNSC